MAKLVYSLSQSLDGYVDHDKMEPGPALFRYFIELMGRVSGSLYGRKVYELMRYWEEDDPQWPEDFREFAAAWRKGPKWVVSRTLKSVGPNATLIEGDLATAVKRLKAEHDGEIEVAGPVLAQSLTELGLIDEYRPIYRPFVLERGAPFFAGPTPALKFLGQERLGEDAVQLRYAPA
jgi:dihydrofolate reductase